MEPDERRSLVERLRSSRDAFLNAANVSENQAKFKPAAGQWSISEIAEHVAVAEHGMFRLITSYSEPLDSPADSAREEVLFNQTQAREKKLEAPDRVRPRGRYGSFSDALAMFRENRERTIRYIDECQEDLRRRSTEHIVGRISCQECLMILIAHPLRHAAQIREIQLMPGYPFD